MQIKPATKQIKHAAIFAPFFPVLLKTKLLLWAAPCHNSLWYHQAGDRVCWLQTSNVMQSLPIAHLTFTHTHEDQMPAVSVTSPSNSFSEMSATFWLALIRLTLLSPSKPPHVDILSASECEAARKTKCHPHASHGLPSVTAVVAPQPWVMPVARWSHGGWTHQPETALLPAGQGCEDGLAPQDTPPFFRSYHERSPVLKQSTHAGFCCPLACPENNSSP